MAKVKISTTMGDITVRLYDETPLHRDNFLKLASEEFFNGTLFHRVIKGFMGQSTAFRKKYVKSSVIILGEMGDYYEKHS